MADDDYLPPHVRAWRRAFERWDREPEPTRAVAFEEWFATTPRGQRVLEQEREEKRKYRERSSKGGDNGGK